ncbi:MAG: hypothetical protein RMK29_18340 [Myxococcales bacterium]|nr:hypothetical protein [Myxococcota bacterium]MDW8283668.1 hypothetical protein [Myxococcales bacterium]
MAAARQRKTVSSKQSRRTRAAYELGRALLQRVQEDPTWQGLQQEAGPLLVELREAVEILAIAPQLRIGAARRLQGVVSRRRTTAQALFEMCVAVRQRIKHHFRGPRHAALRRAFGEGLPASPAKPGSTLQLATQILEAAATHPDAVRRVHVRAQSLARLQRLREELRAATPEKGELRQAQQQIAHNLAQIAQRVEELVRELSARVGQRPPLPRSSGTRAPS